MIQIRFQSECELEQLETLKSKIYSLDECAQMWWFADLITYNVRVEVSSKIPKSDFQEIESLCKAVAILNFIEVYNQEEKNHGTRT